MSKLREAMSKLNVEIPRNLKRQDVVPWVLGCHLLDCVLDRQRTGEKLDAVLVTLNDGKGGGIAPTLSLVYGHLASDIKAANDWRMTKKGFLESGSRALNGASYFFGTKAASRSIMVIAGSVMTFVLYRVGGIELAAKFLHWIFG